MNSAPTEDKNLPCPFCGGKGLDILIGKDNEEVDIVPCSLVCSDCFAAGPAGHITRGEIADIMSASEKMLSGDSLEEPPKLPKNLLDTWNERKQQKDEYE